MFKSKTVANDVKPSISCKAVLILGMGNGFLIEFPKITDKSYSLIILLYDYTWAETPIPPDHTICSVFLMSVFLPWKGFASSLS
jgi:hypothetical protein